MSDFTTELGKLTQLRNSLTDLTQPHTELVIPPITNEPIDNNAIDNTLAALLTESNIQHREEWAAHMSAPVSTASLFGQLIAAMHGGNLLSAELYPVLDKIEHQLIQWLCQLFHQQYGHFVTGSTYANLEALWQAKQQANDSSKCVYASSSAHYSIAKACHILDLKLSYIKCDENDRMSVEALNKACEEEQPIAIVATLGTTAAGSIDPIADCIKLAQQYDAWCHVDAAWGGMLAPLTEYQTLFQLLANADSVCFDPHKGWQQPKPSSVLLYQQALTPMFTEQANYLASPPVNTLPGSHGGELFLPLWFNIINMGIDTLRDSINTRLTEAKAFAEQLQHKTTWPTYLSDTAIVCFSPDSEVNLDKLVDEGYFSKAKLGKVDIYRAVFTCTNTTANALLKQLNDYL